MISKFNHFNEKLKADTYKSAADKLRKLGHDTRASKLNNHMSRRLSDHIFNFWIFGIEFVPGRPEANGRAATPHKHIYKNITSTPIQGTLEAIDFDRGYFEDASFESSRPLGLSMIFKIDKSKLEKKSQDFLEDYITTRLPSGHENKIDLFSLQPEIGMSDERDKIKITDLTSSNIDTFHGEFIGKFSDRKSAVELKKALKNMLFNKIPQYGGDKDEHTDELLTVSDSIRDSLMKTFSETTLEEVHDLYYKICNINTNLLYSEDGVYKTT